MTKCRFRPWVKIVFIVMCLVVVLFLLYKADKATAVHCPQCGEICAEYDGDGHTFEVCPTHGSVEPQ